MNYFHREIHVLNDMLMPGGKCHPNIVEFYDMFQIEGHFQLVMEYVAGKNALDWVTAHDAAAADRLRRADRPGLALRPALRPRQGLRPSRHQAFEPAGDGPGPAPACQAFGFRPGQEHGENAVFSNLTRQGDVGGSIGFLSPEHIRQFGEVKEPADIYCAGATLFYLLTEKYPYLGFDPGRPTPTR